MCPSREILNPDCNACEERCRPTNGFALSGPEVIKPFSYSIQLSTKFILLINVKMPTIVGILTFISMINKHLRDLKQETSLFVCILVFMSS